MTGKGSEGEFSVPDDPVIALVKVLPKGAVQLPPEVRQRLGLKPGTKLILATAEDAVVMRKAEVLLERRPSRGIVNKLRSIFSQIPISDVRSPPHGVLSWLSSQYQKQYFLMSFLAANRYSTVKGELEELHAKSPENRR